jgi:hypothetical protein
MPSSRRKPALLAAALAAALALGILVAWGLGAFGSEASSERPRISAREARQLAEGGSAPAAPRGRPVTVTLGEPAGPTVPGHFLGLSFEATATPLLARYARAGNLATLLRSLGPGVIRIGGVTVDSRAAWSPQGAARPSWASVAITRRELEGLASLARDSGWQVLLSVNAGHDDPHAAAQEAAAARALLGDRLVGVAIGNEPDRYEREGLRGAGWNSAEYLRQVATYRAAIARAAPGVRIVAPDASSGIPPLPWVSAAAAGQPALLSDHYYPLSSCGGEKPVVGELASAVLRAHEAEMLRRLRAIQRASRLPLAIDETGSISCHGEPGVSNSFAAALWAVDWIGRAMNAGIAGLDFHDLVTEPGAYSPLVLPAGAARAGGAHPAANLRANPDWYALLLAAPLAGSAPVSVQVSGDANLTAAAFATARGREAGRERVLLVNFDPPSATPLLIHLRVPPAFVSGSILRLMAPSPASVAHVQLGAAEVSSTGAWSPKLPLPRLYGGPGALSLELPASSAALVTLESHPPAPR